MDLSYRTETFDRIHMEYMCIVAGLVQAGLKEHQRTFAYYGTGRIYFAGHGVWDRTPFQQAMSEIPIEDREAFTESISYAALRQQPTSQLFQWPDNDYILLGVFDLPAPGARHGPYVRDTTHNCISITRPEDIDILVAGDNHTYLFRTLRETLQTGANDGAPNQNWLMDAAFPNVAIIRLAYCYLEHWLALLGLPPRPLGFGRELYAVINHWFLEERAESPSFWDGAVGDHQLSWTILYRSNGLATINYSPAEDGSSYGLEEFGDRQLDWKRRGNTLRRTYAAWKAGKPASEVQDAMYADSGAWMGMRPDLWPEPTDISSLFLPVQDSRIGPMSVHGTARVSLSTLPMDVFLEICDHLTYADICNILHTCRSLHSVRNDIFRYLFTRPTSPLVWVLPAGTVPDEAERFNEVVFSWWRLANGDAVSDGSVVGKATCFAQAAFPHYAFALACLRYLPLWNRERLFKIARQYMHLFREYRDVRQLGPEETRCKFVERSRMREALGVLHADG